MRVGKWFWLPLLLAMSGSVWGQSTGQNANRTGPTDSSATQSVTAADPGAVKPASSSDPMSTIPYSSGQAAQPASISIGSQKNFLQFGTDFSTRYDDNILGSNSNRIADTGFWVSPEVIFSRTGSRLGLNLDYRPSLLYYRHQSNYDEHDENLALDANYRASERVSLRMQTGFNYFSGYSVPFRSSSLLPEIGGPGGLNQTVWTPYNSQFKDDTRVDINYRLGLRSSVGVFASYSWRYFERPPNGSAPLLDSEGKTAGIQYARLMSPRTSLGLVYSYEDLHVGPDLKMGLHTPAVAFSVRFSPRIRLDTFAGPVFTQLNDAARIPYGPILLIIPISRDDWHWAAGGDVIVQGRNTTLEIDGSRAVTDGGGLLTAVTSDTVSASIDRRLARRWSLKWAGGWLQNDALPSVGVTGSLNGEFGRVVIQHSLSERVTAGVGYEYRRQRGTLLSPLGSTFDRNYVYFNLSYRFRQLPVGR